MHNYTIHTLKIRTNITEFLFNYGGGGGGGGGSGGRYPTVTSVYNVYFVLSFNNLHISYILFKISQLPTRQSNILHEVMK